MHMERAIVEHLTLHPQVCHVCLFAQPINRIDATVVEVFGQMRTALAARGVTLHISGIKSSGLESLASDQASRAKQPGKPSMSPMCWAI